MPLSLVRVIVARTRKTHLGGGDYAEVETAVPGSPFLARVYRTAQKSFLPDEAPEGTATVDEQRRLSVLDPACPVQVGDVAFLPEAGGSLTRAKIIRCRPYSDRCQYDLETGAEGNAPPPGATMTPSPSAGMDIAEYASADAAAAGPALDVAEYSSAGAADTGPLDASATTIAALEAQVSRLERQLGSGNDFGLPYTGTGNALVCAHYVCSNQDYGGGVLACLQDIQDAAASGIDGFALNLETLDPVSDNQINDAADMFAAAALFDPEGLKFRLFFSLNLYDGTVGAIVALMQRFTASANYWRVGGQVLLTTYGGLSDDAAATKAYWRDQVLAGLSAAGISAFFFPNYGHAPAQLGSLTPAQTAADYEGWYDASVAPAGCIEGMALLPIGTPVNDPYMRVVPAPLLAPGTTGGLTVWTAHAEHVYDPTAEFGQGANRFSVGDQIMIAPGDPNLNAGTYTIVKLDGGYTITDIFGVTAPHNLITVDPPSIWKGGGATGSGYTVQSASQMPSKGASLLAQEAMAALCNAKGLSWMPSVTPGYWAAENNGQPYAEYHGLEGVAAQWLSILTVQKPLFAAASARFLPMLFTWNDFVENTFFSPIDDVAKYWAHTQTTEAANAAGYMCSHAGFARLSSYFAQWYKTGAAPTIAKDEIIYDYRPHLSTSTVPGTARPGLDASISDDIHVFCLLTAPATVTATTTAGVTTFDAPAGMSNFRAQMNPGSVSLAVHRSGALVLSVLGPPIQGRPAIYNFGQVSGYKTAS